MAYKDTLNTCNSQINIELSALLTNIFLFLGLLSFVTSLFLPSFFTSDGDIIGGWVFIMGWMGIVVFQFAWYANPLSILAFLISESRPRISLLLSLLALVVASHAFVFNEIPTGLTTGIHQEKLFIKELGIGFYCWYLSQAFFLLGLLSKSFVSRGNR